jgi:hypothetical protein
VTIELHNHPYANRGRRAALRHPRRSHSSTAVREPVAPATHATSEAPDPSALARVRWRHSGGDSGSARLIGLPRCQSRHRRGGLLSGDIVRQRCDPGVNGDASPGHRHVGSLWVDCGYSHKMPERRSRVRRFAGGLVNSLSASSRVNRNTVPRGSFAAAHSLPP